MDISRVIDLKALHDRIEGDMELLRELHGIFKRDSASIISKIEESIALNDAAGLAKLAHSIKGAVSNFSANRARDAALALEAKGKQQDLRDIGALVDTLRQEVDSCIRAIEILVSRGQW
ncbi:MAG: Hpt domain-containing protein [Spirochaetes bacterium]|nr:Hpt domain-containing protein [Spirochaetota bacterium]